MLLETRSFAFGEFEFDADEKVLRHRQKPVPITPKAFLLLQTLIENPGRLVEKEKLIETVWPDSVVEEGNLSFTMALLRKALGDNRKEPRFIETVPKRGYRFIGQLDPIGRTVAESEATRGTERRPGIQRRAIVLAMPLVALVAVLGAGLAWLIGGSQQNSAEGRLLARTSDGSISVAVVTPDGTYIVFAKKDGTGEALWRKDIASGDQAQLVPPRPVEYVGLSVSPKSDFAYFSVFAANDAIQTLARVPIAGGPEEPLPDIAAGVSVSFSPDGKRIAFTESLSSVNETYLKTANADGSDQRTLVTAKGPDRVFPIFRASPAAWSPDGKSIAVAIQEADEKGRYSKILLVDQEGILRTDLDGGRWNAVENITWLNASDIVLIDAEPNSPARNFWRVSTRTGERVRMSDERSEFEWLSTAGGKVFAVQKKVHSSLYVAEYSEAQNTLRSKQIYAEAHAIEMAAWTTNGLILFNSGSSGQNEIWQINPDGTSPHQLTIGSGLGGSFAVSPADDSLVMSANRDGRLVLVATDPTGQNPRQLTEGTADINPSISVDGRSVVFQRGSLKSTLWSVGLHGGPAAQITGYLAQHPRHSPAGRMISFHFMDFGDKAAKWKLGLIDVTTRRLLNKVEFPVTISHRETAWKPDAGLITLAFETGGDSGILLIDPLTGVYRTIPNAGGGDITSLAWSLDGQSLVFAQKHETTDVVELTGLIVPGAF